MYKYLRNLTNSEKLWLNPLQPPPGRGSGARSGTIGSAGLTVVGGTWFAGSGYSFGSGDKNGNVLLAFSTE
jgi:hypothetical protein